MKVGGINETVGILIESGAKYFISTLGYEISFRINTHVFQQTFKRNDFWRDSVAETNGQSR